MTLHITTPEQFQTQVLDYDGISLVDFRAEWCGPCRMLGPVMDQLATEYAGKKVQIVKVNVDELPGIAGQFGVSSIPAVFIVKDKKVVDTIIGANPKTIYQVKIDALNPSIEDQKMAN